jgi:mxaD protein
VWSSDFQRDEKAANVNDQQAREAIAGIYKAGFEGLRTVFPAR